MGKYLTLTFLGLLILMAVGASSACFITGSEAGSGEPPRQAMAAALDGTLSIYSCAPEMAAKRKRMDTIFVLINNYGLVAIFGLLMLGIAGIPVPDELILTFAGYLVFKGVLQPLHTIVTCCLGSVCGISLSYFLGHAVGIPLVEKYGQIFHLTVDKINLVHDWFNRIGKWTLMVGYFIPGVRHLTGFAAGISQLEILVFARYAYAGAFCWTITFLSIGFLMGNQWCKIRSHLYLVSIVGIVLILAIITGYAIIAKKQQQEVEISQESKKASKQSG